MRWSVLASLVAFGATATHVVANEKPAGGGSNYAFIDCYGITKKEPFQSGRNVYYNPRPYARTRMMSVDPNGYLAGVVGDYSGDSRGDCQPLVVGRSFTVFSGYRSYDNGRSSEPVDLYVDVVSVNGQKTLNIRSSKGGGCNLPVESEHTGQYDGSTKWHAGGDYAHHCY